MKLLAKGVLFLCASSTLFLPAGEMTTKKQKNKVTGKTRTIPFFEPKDTFFNYFKTKEVIMLDEDEVRLGLKM